jgi:hypothetical protein
LRELWRNFEEAPCNICASPRRLNAHGKSGGLRTQRRRCVGTGKLHEEPWRNFEGALKTLKICLAASARLLGSQQMSVSILADEGRSEGDDAYHGRKKGII